jgi:hypothetical protein
MTEQNLPVFRRVGANLQRIPNDVRDPVRRYSQTSNVETGEQYVVEFTDEEERQADEDARRWAEEQPKREAEEKRQQEEFEEFKAALVYQKRIVAFLDVLGWADAAERSRFDPELAKSLGVALTILKAQGEMAAFMRQGGDAADPQVSQFSDAIAISFVDDPDNGWWAKSHLQRSLNWIAGRLLDAGLLVRGGVVSDLLIHRDGMVYGPALKRAYDLEHATREPRIVLDDELAERWWRGEPVSDKGCIVHVHQEWLLDDDGRYFFDYLQPMGGGRFPVDPAYLKHLLAPAQKAVQVVFADQNAKPSILQKYIWLAKYLNRTLEQYGPCDLLKIEISPSLIEKAKSKPGSRD